MVDFWHAIRMSAGNSFLWETCGPNVFRGEYHDITVLYCTVLYCTILYCTVLYCTVPRAALARPVMTP